MTTATVADLTALVTDLYRTALRDDALDADSDFFVAGGDSLAAFQIVAGLAELGREVPVALVFTWPTPAELAAAVEEEDA